MKRYLLIGIALLFVNANASLKEDFAQLDEEEDLLLTQIKKSSLSNSEVNHNEEMKDEAAISMKSLEPEQVIKEVSTMNDEKTSTSSSSDSDKVIAASVESTTSEPDSMVTPSDPKENADDIRQQEIKKAKEIILQSDIEAKEAEIKKAKEEQEKVLADQRAEEKREVEAYEKQRAEKLALEAAEKAELEKKRQLKETLDTKTKQKNMEKSSIFEISAEESEKPIEKVDSLVNDVNVSRELEEKTRAADIEYRNAVLEMEKED